MLQVCILHCLLWTARSQPAPNPASLFQKAYSIRKYHSGQSQSTDLFSLDLFFLFFHLRFFFLSFFYYMKAIFTAKAVLSKMQWLWLILSQLYYLAARWSAVLKWIMNPWNWLSVTFIILMERQVRSGLTTSHANETTTVTSACLKAFICPERKVMP